MPACGLAAAMKLEKALLGLLLAMAVAFGLALLIDEPGNASGLKHEAFATMFRGGDAQRHGSLLWIGWALGALEILFFTGLLALGARSGGRLHGLGGQLIVGLLGYLAVWSALMLAYADWMSSGDASLFMGWPAATAWMLFALWPVPLVFVACYSLGFSRWIYPPESQRKFQLILEQRRAFEAASSVAEPGDE
jgi:hypothetical protein